MKKITPFLSLLFIGLMLFNSCIREESSDVNQDKIHTAYEMFYNANQDKTYARAIFKFSNVLGTQLQLTAPSQITFNGDVLTFQNTLAYYEKEYAGYIASGTFVWSDVNGISYTNTVHNKVIDYPANLDTIPRNAAYEMFWVGDSLSANERVVLTINGILEGDVQVFSQNNLHAKSIILALNQLQTLGQGQGSMWFDRYYEPGLTEKTSAGGSITARYRPINKTVFLD